MKSAVIAWLQNGYRNFKDAIKSLEYVEYVDEIRIFDAVFHEKSRSSSRVGINFMSQGKAIYPQKGKMA